MKFLLPLIVFLIACDQSDPEAPTKCKQFVSLACQAVTTCTDITPSACLASFKDSLDCDKAIGVSPDYNTCMSTLMRSWPCSSLVVNGEVTFPPVCAAAVVIEK